MATEKSLFTDSYVAGEDLSDMKYRYVKIHTDGKAYMIDSAAESKRAMGILQNNPTSGETAKIMWHGISKLVANAALAIGAKVKAEYVGAADNGKGDAADTDKDYVNGEVVLAATAEDEYCEVILVHYTLSI